MFQTVRIRHWLLSIKNLSDYAFGHNRIADRPMH
nr:MAG TPA: hypothetical protein [Caudoviricetes sp.]